jgi:hypothetical protein
MPDEAPLLDGPRMTAPPGTYDCFCAISPDRVHVAEMHGCELRVCREDGATLVTIRCPTTSRLRCGKVEQMVYEEFNAEDGSEI